MTDKDTDNKLDENKPIDLMRDYRLKAVGISMISLVILLIVFTIYFHNFGGLPIGSQEDFGTFGDFVGGRLILSLLLRHL